MSEIWHPLSSLVSEVRKISVGVKDKDLPYVGLEHIDSGALSITRTATADTSVSANFKFSAGDILFGKLRPALKKCAQADFCGYCSTDILVLRSFEHVDPRFAAWTMASDGVFSAAIRGSEGTRMPRASWRSLRQLYVFVPSMLEQQNIVDILDALDERIRCSERVLQKLELSLRGLIEESLNEERVMSSEIDLLGNLLIKDPQNGIYKPLSSYDSTGVPIIRIDRIRDAQIVSPETLPCVIADNMERHLYSLEANDILVNRVNTAELVGKVALIDENSEGALFESNMMRLHIDPGRMRPEFGALWLSSSSAQSHFRSCAKSAVAQASINQRDVLSCPMPRLNLECQDQILGAVGAARRSIESQGAELEKLQLLRIGLMDDLLTGKVRVTRSGELTG